MNQTEMKLTTRELIKNTVTYALGLVGGAGIMLAIYAFIN